MTILSLDVLLFLFGSSLLFHVRFYLLLPDLHIGFSRGRSDAEDIKKRWQDYTEELYKKHLNDPDNHDDVISHLEPDILEREVK